MFCTRLVHIRWEQGHVGVCLLPDILQSGGSYLHLSPLTWMSEVALIPGYSTGFTRGLLWRPEMNVQRKSLGASQCLHVLARTSPRWIWTLSITASALSKTQTSPWKTVSHLWSFLHCSQILCGGSLILHMWSLGSVLGSSHYESHTGDVIVNWRQIIPPEQLHVSLICLLP